MKQPYENLAKIKKDKEIKALYMFNHPNIIKLIDVLFDESNRILVVKFRKNGPRLLIDGLQLIRIL